MNGVYVTVKGISVFVRKSKGGKMGNDEKNKRGNTPNPQGGTVGVPLSREGSD